MEALYNELAKRNKFGRWQVQKQFWGALDNNIKDFEIRVTELNSSSVYIIDGHWSQRLFNTTLFGRNAEYVQLIRDCRGWVTSKVDYGLFDCVAAKKAIKNKTYDDYLKVKLKHTNVNYTNVDQCLADYDCLRNAKVVESPNGAVRYICDKSCPSTYNYDINTIPTLNNPDLFIAVGVLSHIEKYLYVLECAYPNILRGIKALYESQHTLRKISNKSHNTKALQTLVNETCERSIKYNEILAKAERVLVNQYDYLVANKGKCCRRPLLISE